MWQYLQLRMPFCLSAFQVSTYDMWNHHGRQDLGFLLFQLSLHDVIQIMQVLCFLCHAMFSLTLDVLLRKDPSSGPRPFCKMLTRCL